VNKLAGEKVEIFNQVAETLKVRDLATLIAGKTGVEIRNLENPRKEDAENELQVRAIRLILLLKNVKISATRLSCDVTYRF
jgi:UDP-sulfoquinovose synthase